MCWPPSGDMVHRLLLSFSITRAHSPRIEPPDTPAPNRRYRESLAATGRLPVVDGSQSRSQPLDCLDPTGRKVVEPHDDLYPVLKTYGAYVGGVSCVVSSLYCSIDIKTGGMARGWLPREVWFSLAVIFSVVRTLNSGQP